MRLVRFGLAILLILAGVWGCKSRVPEESMTSGHAVIGASDAVFDLAWFVSREFQTGNPGAFVDIVRNATSNLVDSLANNRAEEIFLDRQLTPAETLFIRKAGYKLYTYPVAYYPAFWLVSQSNPVTAIDSASLRGILTGTITNWRDLGGDNEPINAYIPPLGEGAIQSLFEYYGHLDTLSVAAVCTTMAAMLDSARDDPGALLLYSKPYAELPYKALRFRTNGAEIPADVKTILDEDYRYPFHLNITYVTTHNKMDVAAGYLTFAVGNLGQRRIMDGFRYRPASVPVRVIRMKSG